MQIFHSWKKFSQLKKVPCPSRFQTFPLNTSISQEGVPKSQGGGFSHWHGILLGRFFAKFGIAIRGFHQRWRSPVYINWVYFGPNIVKSTQVGQNWVLFLQKWYIDGWEIRQKIGIESQIFEVQQAHPRTILVKVTPLGPNPHVIPPRKRRTIPWGLKNKQTDKQTTVFTKESCQFSNQVMCFYV